MKKALLFSIFIYFISCTSEVKNTNIVAKGGESSSIKESEPLFQMVPKSRSNIDFANIVTETEDLNIVNYHYFYNGGGVACGDINNDGLIDLYFTANLLPDKLYLNKGGLVFEDISEKIPSTTGLSWTTGVTMADVNADGYLDIYVCRSGKLSPEDRRNKLFINNGDLSFSEQSKEYGLDDPAYSTQATFFDYDKDGDLDMFLLNHEIKDLTNYNRQIRETGRDANVGDKLYRNDNGRFKEVGKESGINANPYGFGLGVAIGDLNGDHWPDIYVTNDFIENDFLYYNNKDGTFQESIKSSTQHISNYGMGVDISDFNNDGLQDILVVDMVAKDNFRQKTNMSGMNPEKFWQTINFGIHYQYMGNSLQMNQNGGKFSEVSQMAGVFYTDWSWAALMADLDNDGEKDIIITNGLRKEIRNNDFIKKYMVNTKDEIDDGSRSEKDILKMQLSQMPSKKISNYIFQNQKNMNFEDKTSEWGLSVPSFSTGAAYADLDNDGDLDLIMNNVDEVAHLYENKSNEIVQNNYLTINLKGSQKNPFGIGAEIIVTTDQNEQHLEIYHSRGFQSSVSVSGHFGLGSASEISSVQVIWPDGKKSEIQDPEINQRLEIKYSSATSNNQSISKEKLRFQDITKDLNVNFTHKENDYNDFIDQVLLPHKLSNLGPALAVGDIDSDGLDDFYVGGAMGFTGIFYKQTKDGKFNKMSTKFPKNHIYYEDVDAVFFDADGDADLDLYVASGGYEFDSTSENLHDRLYLNDGNGNYSFSKNSLPQIKVSTGCVKPFDFDKDGDLDLFVGGRVLPKHYPFPPKSYILINENGKFTDATSTLAPRLNRIGMVTDAEWIDVDSDGDIELVLAGEWMPITIFSWKDGKFTLIEQSNNGLEKSNGWWYSLQKLDYDNDGDMDFIGGNLGTNYKYQATLSSPFKVFSDDFDNNQHTDIVLSYAENGTYYPVRGRECSSQQMPYIKEKFPDYKSFGMATLRDVLGAKLSPTSLELNVYTFATTLFENKGNMKFESIVLNSYVQISSINDIVAEDIDRDGIQDLVMAGNLLFSEVETPRNDAGYGNILLGSKSKNFELIPPLELNFFGEGEVKKIRTIRINNNYTAYLVARNSGPLSIYRFE